MAVIFNQATQTGGVDDDILVGSGSANSTMSGGAGDDLVYGDYQTFYHQGLVGTTFATAGNIGGNSNVWNIGENSDTLNATSVPHASSIIESDGDYHWYRLDMNQGQRLTVDIDYGNHVIGDAVNTMVQLYEGDGTTLVRSNNDSFVSSADFGSTSSQDSRMEHTVASTGTYYVRISNSAGDPVPLGATFVANFSLTGKTVSSNAIVAGHDLIEGGAGNDVLHGMGGNDTISGGADIDLIFGGSGNDIINGGEGKDSANGGSGDDTFAYIGAELGDDINGDSGTDTLDLSGWLGTAGFDVDLKAGRAEMIGNTLGTDAQYRVRSIENVVGSDDADDLTGSDGNNAIYGGAGDDTIAGGSGNDILDGGLGSNELSGGLGNDKYRIDGSTDTIIEAANQGTDTVFASVDFEISAGASIEILKTDTVNGTDPIALTGNELRQRIFGNQGDNEISDGGGAADVMVGRGGDDTYQVNHTKSAIREKAGNGQDTVQTSVDFNLRDVWRVETLETQDALGTSNLELTGNRRDNTINGNDGDNVITGARGNDTMTGNGGADTFILSEPNTAAHRDVITDFTIGEDIIHLESGNFTRMGEGALDAVELVINTTGEAEVAGNRLIYNSDTGEMSFDRDGTGVRTAKVFLTLDAGLSLTTDDFLVI